MTRDLRLAQALVPVQCEGDDSLTDELLAGNSRFQSLVAKSKAGLRRPFSWKPA